MTTLFVIVFLIGGSVDGGASVTTQRIDFYSAEQCEAARKAVEASGEIWSNGAFKGGRWKVTATCVRNTK